MWLDELVAYNPMVPQDAGLLETAWELLQFNPHAPAKEPSVQADFN